ncbi:MAG: protein translocase subunit SecD [Candidatus Paceibacterota bacterium]
MIKTRLSALALLILGLAVGFFVYSSEVSPESRFPFKLGLDLSGGTHLVYKADVSDIPEGEEVNSMEALRDVIERRVNLFGVAEPLVQVERTAGIFSEDKEHRLIVELPGVTDVDEATAMIGRTPLLEFKLEEGDTQGETTYIPTELTGRYIKRATLGFHSVSNEPQVLLSFTSEGADIFKILTEQNVGRALAIFLDGAPISTPIIREVISGGTAEITGRFTPEEARKLVGRINSGALPVPIELLSTQTIGATLGKDATEKGVRAGLAGLIAVSLFMLLWYRLNGFVALVSLTIYIALMLALFKVIPVTLTAAGIAGFILSIGMAVDANILIFERVKEEIRNGTALRQGIRDGFTRAWLAIRDSNISSIITAVILFWFGTSLIQGFALVFGIGVLVSMITAISVTRTLLLAVSREEAGSTANFLFGSGFKK